VLEGLNRNTGIHAAGVLITPSPLIEHAPLYKSSKGDVTVQFDMNMSEALGLLKMDFLGLRTLTVIDKALDLVAATTGERLRADEIPTDDARTYELLQQGRTVGVFQLESSGMQELARKLQPTCWGDITAICALYRPGPLGADMDKVYVERKHGRLKVEYKDPVLEPILKDTYGVILYQEQVMQIASAMGGFTMGQADTLRKAMGKKKMEMMAAMKVQFLAGAEELGFAKRVAVEIYEEMEFFAQYGFNKSHSAAYALLSIQTAWLKAHHPAEFMAATMTTEMRKSERITQLIDECKALGLVIRPPDINLPHPEFGVVDGEIVFGMGAVKGVGSAAIEAVGEARDDLGRDFNDLFDLCEHGDLQKVNRKVIEGLIDAGALDRLPGHRRQLRTNLDRALAFGQKTARDRAGGQTSLFGSGEAAEQLRPTLTDCDPYDPLDELSRERAAVGFFLSGHPFHEYRELVASLPTGTAAGVHRRGESEWVDLVGVITSHTKHRDRHKRVYARANFEDPSGVVSLTVYAKQYEEAQELVESDSILVVGGRVQMRSDGTREIVVDRLTRIDEVLGTWVRDVFLEMDLMDAGKDGVAALGELFARFGEPCTPRPLGGRAEEEAAEEPGPVPVADGDPDAPAATPGAVAVLARPVPLVVETKREDRTWLIKSGGRNIALTLESLRALRRVPGVGGLRLRVVLPSAPQKRTGFFDRNRTRGRAGVS